MTERPRERRRGPSEDLKGGLVSFAVEALVVVVGVAIAIIAAVIVMALV